MMADRLRDVLVVGLGVSGEASARYFLDLPEGERPERVRVVDEGDSDILRERADRLTSAGADVGLATDTVAEHADLAVISPGIPPRSPLYAAAREQARETIGEIELAFRVSHAPWIAVTGTNGKTTVTSLIAHVLRSAGMVAEAVGNIGRPAIEVARDTHTTSVIVAEVSSFQLHSVDTFRPRVGVLLNITPDHMDWHGSMESYIADKSRMFANMDHTDTAVVNVDDLAAAEVATDLSLADVHLVTVTLDAPERDGAGIVDGRLVLDHQGHRFDLCAVDDLLIRGDHNVGNALVAAAAAHACGADPDALRWGLASFEPIEHRLEPVGEIDGAEYYNDSKATNVDAVLKALTAFSDRSLVLLLGGRAKGTSFDTLASAVAECRCAAVAFGEAGPEIADALEDAGLEAVVADGMREAFSEAHRMSRPGDVVLLSPACASFDEFANYRERGHAFKQMVAEAGGDGA
jgi:UDP-N-acetylmuramoylalanine--D-glutamate ligase